LRIPLHRLTPRINRFISLSRSPRGERAQIAEM
jgi:hypothetical protein